jgi:hypothetical protein
VFHDRVAYDFIDQLIYQLRIIIKYY